MNLKDIYLVTVWTISLCPKREFAVSKCRKKLPSQALKDG